MQYKYGHFKDTQFEGHKKSLKKAIFWLLLYKDPKTKDDYPNLDFDKYFDGLMRRIDGLNHLLSYPTEIITLLSTLQAAKLEADKDNFNFKIYRKLILDAGSLVDKIKVGE